MESEQRQADARPRAAGAGWRLRRLLVVLLLAVPGAAHPYTLERLLQMSLEQLLQIEFTPSARLTGAPSTRSGGSDAC